LDITTNTVSWPVFDLAAGSSVEFQLTINVSLPTPIPAQLESLTNTATAQDDGSNGQDPTPDNNTATDTNFLPYTPDLAVTKSNGVEEVIVGSTVVYEINVTNSGTQAASWIVVRDSIPAGTTMIPSMSTPGWVCPMGGGPGDECIFTIPVLNPNDAIRIEIALETDSPSALSELMNTASVEDDGNSGTDPTPENNTDSDNDPVFGA